MVRMAASERKSGTGGRGEDRKQTPEEIAEPVSSGAEPILSVAFFRTETGNEPVRDWLRSLPRAQRKINHHHETSTHRVRL
jgi:hypothetical protein